MQTRHSFGLETGNHFLGRYLHVKSEPIEHGSVLDRVLRILDNYKQYTIADLVKLVDGAGTHDQFESPRKATSTRKMYQVIRELRDMNCPIVGDSKGIYLAKTVQQVRDFSAHLEQKAKSDIKSMMILRKKMMHMINDHTPSLFDDL